MGYAGRYRVFTYASWVLSAISALTALVPFLYIWMILRDVLAAAPDYAQAVKPASGDSSLITTSRVDPLTVALSTTGALVSTRKL